MLIWLAIDALVGLIRKATFSAGTGA